ncbi:Diguanylate cyclase [Sphingomonas sp. EC-HK361]|uniref:putative bifunctional diguanylate cyclase/phosphodiesterase n=1 Tax=Sphingomonas sp. EC-HK361 TaxID=2038397 RepID=UPI0012586350|nr:bifunctional diguanylate cyclase/phosphodiesterase [Sphingomonas sp. EC-HK361]VVT13035.1 Diguanylate cyclase [Sphingomonas sp. EC-HK361]
MAKETEFGEVAFRAREIAVVAITGIAILLFVALGGTALGGTVNRLLGGPDVRNTVLLSALILNVALILMGWRRQRDLSAYNHTADRARVLANQDLLTGLSTRRHLAEQGGDLLRLAARRDKAVAAILCDIDALKDVNDRHGTDVGDALLVHVARLLESACPRGALIARFDGDRYAACFLFDPHLPQTIDSAVERFVAAVARPAEIAGITLAATTTIGLARSDEVPGGIDTLLNAAARALAAADAAGRNRQAWFDASMTAGSGTDTGLDTALTGAVERGEIVPHFDRQIDLATGTLRGFEVLARWAHPDHGLLSASRFLPAADRRGLTAAITLEVMRQAFIAARDWDAALTLSVNISAAQLKDPWLAQKIVKLLTETGFAPGRLEIEITESALIDTLALSRSLVESLRSYGVGVALDDFGTGYSSLTHLRALPFDRIKIDHSFVAAPDSDRDSAALVRAIVQLGESLNITVTAEGIGSLAAMEQLRALGCARGQGRHWGDPMPAAHVRRLLAEQAMLVRSA